MDNDLGVVIVAAGSGTRMKSNINKQYLLINQHPILAYSLDLFEKLDIVKEIVLVVNQIDKDYCQEEIVDKISYKKITAVIEGGKERQDSVWAGLQLVNKELPLVAVHDGARPLLCADLVESLAQEAMKYGAAIPYVKPKDTLKILDENNFVSETLDRSIIAAVQTPQIFRLTSIIEAYKKAYANNYYGTDDSSIYEKYIGKVKLVLGDYKNIKITTSEDLAIAEIFVPGTSTK